MAKILIVDDDPKALKLMGYILHKEGYDIIVAQSGPEALAKLKEEKPDLMILDIMMPDMDGYEVCRRIRADPTVAHIPVIMLTAKAMVEDKIAGFEAGADDYITKPVLPAELVARVKVLLSRAAVPGVMIAKKVGFLGAKGGVGVTSLVINVGVVLAQSDFSVVLMDLQPSGWSIAQRVGFTEHHIEPSFLERQPHEINPAILESYLMRHPSGLRVFPPLYPTQLLEEVPSSLLKRLVENLSTMAQYLLMDFGTRWDQVAREILHDCNWVILVTEPDHLSLTTASKAIKLLDTFDVRGEKLKVVMVNRVRSQTAYSKVEAEKILGHSIHVVIPPAPELFFQAEKENIPVVMLQPNSIIAEQVRAVAQLIQ